jgi:hypothetical protein
MEILIREILKKDFGETDRNDWAALVDYAKTALSFSVCNCYEGAAEVYPILKNHFKKIDEMAKKKIQPIEEPIEESIEQTPTEKQISIDPKHAGKKFFGTIEGKSFSWTYSDLISNRIDQETIKKTLELFPAWKKFFNFE